jgi:Flp pilus assembly protein TadG
MRGRLREDSGVIAIIVAVFSVVMFGLAALVVDLGMAREIKRDAQTAADAAVLAGAGELYTDGGTLQVNEAVEAVKDVAAENFGTTHADWANCSTTLDAGWSQSAGAQSSGTSCIAFYTAPDDSDGLPNQIQVVVPTEPAAVLLGGLVGYEGSDIGAVARSSAVSSQVPSCTLCVFESLTTGSAAVSVTGGGSVHAGSGGDLTAVGSITVADPGTIRFAGTATPPTGPKYSPNPPATNTGVAVKDPFLARAMPSAAGLPNSGAGEVACGPGGVPSLTPGIYDDILIKNTTCSLAAGRYVITGSLTFQAADSRVVGDGVTLFFTCTTGTAPRTCTDEEGGSLVGGRRGISLGSPSSGSEFSVVYDRGNTSPLTLTAEGPNGFLGAVYAKNAKLVIDNGTFGVAAPVVVRSLELSGTSRLSVHEPSPPTVDGPAEVLLTK